MALSASAIKTSAFFFADSELTTPMLKVTLGSTGIVSFNCRPDTFSSTYSLCFCEIWQHYDKCIGVRPVELALP
jgi:hypothetical protein